MQEVVPIRSERMEIVPATMGHLEAELRGREALEAFMDAEVPADWPPGECDRQALEWFRDLLDSEGARVEGWGLWYGVVREGGRRVLACSAGFMGLPVAGWAAIGYSTAEAFRDRGLATEIVRSLTGWAFRSPDLSGIRAATETSNEASAKVLGRCGFVEVRSGSEGLREFELERPDPPGGS